MIGERREKVFYFITFIVGYILSAWHVQKVGSQREKRLDILQARDAMLFRWHNNYYQGIKLADQLRKRNIHSVAICGIGNVGLMLYDELYNSEIEVKYTVDKTGNRHLETAVRGYTLNFSSRP